MTPKNKVEIRPLTQLDELTQLEALQRVTWDDPTTVVYRNTLLNLARNGGIVVGAIDQGRIVGFVLGYLGIESPEADRPAMANLKLVSQRMAVLPEYRNQGIGYELKLAQRAYAIKQGIRLITWTYDPLQTRNAHLNLRKLGAVVRDYWRDYYGTEASPQVVLGSSDRMMVEWWVTSNRVEQRLNGKRGGLGLLQYTDANAAILNPTRVGNSGQPLPGDRAFRPQGMIVLIEVPGDYDAIVRADPELARAWRRHSREVIQLTLGAGYTATDFVRGVHEGRERSFYVLSSAEVPVFGFSNN